MKWSHSSFNGTSITAGKDEVFGRTDPNLIDDSALNFIGLDQADPNAKDDVVHSVIAVPEGRPVELILRSKDVIHNFWVPQLRFKQDLVPGMRSASTSLQTGRASMNWRALSSAGNSTTR